MKKFNFKNKSGEENNSSPKSEVSKFNKTKLKYGGLSIIVIVIVICLAVLLNSIVSLVVSNYNLKFDLTSQQSFGISDQTKDFLKNYNNKVEIIVLDDESTYLSQSAYTVQAYYILKNIAAQNPNITLSFKSLNKNPSLDSKYSQYSLSTGGVLLIDSNEHSRYVSPNDLFYYSTDKTTGAQKILCNVEQSIAHALEYITGESNIKTAIVSGHSELDISSVKSTFESNSYSFENLDLTTSDFPSDTNFAIIACPTSDYSPQDIQKVSNFLNRGGKLAYFASSRQSVLPNLEGLIKQYGINFANGTVVDTDYNNVTNKSGSSFFVYAQENDYTKSMPDKTLPIAVAESRPMGAFKVDGVKTSSNLDTYKTCINWPNDNENFDAESAKKQFFAVNLISEKEVAEGKSSCIAAFSSIEMLGPIQSSTYGNGGFMLSVFGKINNHQSAVTVLPKSLDANMLNINLPQSITIGIVFIVVVPVATLVTGIIICSRRKRRR